MKVYYLQNTELGWDNVVSIAISPQKCIEDYTWGEVILETEEDVENYLKDNKTLFLMSTTLKN
jgi:hypothetical protein